MKEPASLIRKLREVVAPQLLEFERQLHAQFPSVESRFYEGEVGQLTEYDGYHIGLECIFSGVPPTAPASVALEISVRGKNTAPEIDAAHVVWGHPSGQAVADLLPEPISLTPEQVDTVAARVPELCSALAEALSHYVVKEVGCSMAEAELLSLIHAFIAGEDRSMSAAGRIESALDELFGDEEPFYSVTLGLASFQPSGGEYLYDEQQVAAMLASLLPTLEARISGPRTSA